MFFSFDLLEFLLHLSINRIDKFNMLKSNINLSKCDIFKHIYVKNS